MGSYTGHGAPSLRRRVLDGVWLRGVAHTERILTIDDGSTPPLRFRVRNVHEYNRATNALHNEPGTLRWIAEQVRPGDVFYDVGANVGVFALLAAHRTGPGGRVVAFEPHAATTATLLDNVLLNGLGERIDVLSCALHRTSGHVPFVYRSLVAGSGLSTVGESDHSGARELKPASTADDLIAAGTIAPADLIKIDVDGTEADVLAGMRGLLAGPRRPRSVQVEVTPSADTAVPDLMSELGYRETARHRTLGVEQLLRDGADPASLGANLIFEPAA